MNSNLTSLYLLAHLLIAGLSCAEQPGANRTQPQIEEARKEAAARRRRIIYNDDGCHVRMYDTPDNFLSLRLRQIADTQVDSVFYCTGVTGMFFTHFPQVGELIGDNDASLNPGKIKCRDSMAALKKAGHDPLAMAVDFCHEESTEVFWSLRMNDIHDSYGEHLVIREKYEHPDWCLGTRANKGKFSESDPAWWWSALNYEVPQVRDMIFRFCEDVCGRYAVDGIELDFFRAPLFFKPSTELEPVTPRHVSMMTDLLRRIRQMTEEVGRRRGRPILVACRVPLDAQQSLSVGLDLKTWLEQDLLDVMVLGGGYAPMAMAPAVRNMVQLGHRHHVAVYACISRSAMYGEFASVEAWRGAAMNVWSTGADGVYTFNLFPSERDQRLSQLGDVDTLKGLDKVYGIDNVVKTEVPGAYKLGLVTPDRLPVVLKPNTTVLLRMPVGEDIVANAPTGAGVSVKLRLQVAQVLAGDEIVVRLNGKDLPPGTWDHSPQEQAGLLWTEFAPNPAVVRAGTNRVEVRLVTDDAAGRRPVSVEVLAMSVRYQ